MTATVINSSEISMTTFAIIGAGRGLGATVARRFASEGFEIALVSRSAERVESLAADLRAEGVSARGYVADVRDVASIARTLDEVTAQQGPIEVLQYSPLPDKSFLRPVLETTPADTAAAVEFSVYGPMAAVHQVLQGMRVIGRGTVLFVNGGSAVKPGAHVAGTSIAFAGQSAYAQMMHETLAPEDIHVAQLIIPGAIEEGSAEKDPDVLAEKLWTIHAERGEFRTYAASMEGED
ncbi:SDR family NAD(P)-dependent oxidoreductase [Aeromicrobium sp. CF4.19]|uniref:SDR family NAD(P)-dependent oxidoreductase n=1 Tax=Aeromicrobium sp. CF4.19 TaxID=3373082 RepID=UPI003EE4DE84